ncbi:MAG: bifunctional folylpolyglutamate synthase/dihydrofolate synthase [Nitrospirae bacterium]|nr:bifunctional folylpolyglutamate synthase/dihydrofolate synthase [Nitrospirota bacterium]MCL5237438.1 bifunctional folylpolyglutamate synthase/dihydrofolate synthase [Nitrospirota bacterium]
MSYRYRDAIDYLYGLQKYGIKLGIEKPEKILSLLGNPHKGFLSIHVAGTNGKGSVSAMISSMLMAHGYKVGLFTSPHLVSFTERIRIDNKYIPESEVVALTEEIRFKIQNSKFKVEEPTFFEFVTAMAFVYFQRNTIDWAVVETGMGGRLDATNVIVPEVSVITKVSYDHKEFLGNTLGEIAGEKAGIIKRGIPVVCAMQEEEVEAVIRATAESRSSRLFIYGKDFSGAPAASGFNGITFSYNNGTHELADLHTPLQGDHQLHNACLAVKASLVALESSSSKDSNELQVTSNKLKDNSPEDSLLKKGLAATKWQGRLELVSSNPPIMIDGAHNPDAARALSAFIKRHLGKHTIILIIGVMADKDLDGILSPLLPLASHIIFTAPNYGRAADPNKLAEYASASGIANTHTEPTLKEAIGTATKISNELNPPSPPFSKGGQGGITDSSPVTRYSPLILITGSFYTIGEAMEVLGEKAILGSLRETL